MKSVLQRSYPQMCGAENSNVILRHSRNYHLCIIVYVINSQAFDSRITHSVLVKWTIYGALFKKTSPGNEVESSHLSSRAELEAASSVQKWFFSTSKQLKLTPAITCIQYKSLMDGIADVDHVSAKIKMCLQ